MRRLFALFAAAGSISGFCADWNPRLAAEYLDSRQKEWFAWAPAKATGGPCISCHTNMPYLLARPALRKALGQSEPTVYETGLLNALRARVTSTDARDMYPGFGTGPHAVESRGVESIFAALFLPREAGAKAFDRLWAEQVADGSARGAWRWFSLSLDPYEMPQSAFFGATLAAAAVGTAPPEYGRTANVHALQEYLVRERDSQPLHNKLFLLWASSRFPDALDETSRKAIIDEAVGKQNEDGGWTMDALGPWAPHTAAPEAHGSDSYATAVTVWALRSAGVPSSDRAVARGSEWLKAHQDSKAGYWPSESMNKRYPPGSMPDKFMQDAATAFAVLALVAANHT